jgi:hypothetical protein
VLAVLGGVIAVRRGGVAAATALALAAALLVLGSTAAIVDLRLDLVSASFENVQFPRYAIAIKPLFFALAGAGALVVADGVRAIGGRPRARTPTARIVWALALAPLAVAAVEHAGRLVARPVGGIESLQAAGLAEDEQALADAIAREREGLAAGTPLRVAFLRVGMGGGTYPIFTVADAGGALVLDGHVPAVNFLHRVNKRDADALAALGVTHVVHDRPLGERETELADVLAPVGSFGPYTLERFDREPAARVRLVAGDASIDVVEDARERVELAVDGAATVALARAPSSRWIATAADSEIEVGERALAGITVVELEAPGAGTIALSYRRSRAEAIADVVSWLALGLVAIGLARARPLVFVERLQSRAATRISRVIAAACAVVIAVWIVRRQDGALARTWEEVADDVIERTDSKTRRGFGRDLVIEGAIEVEREPANACMGILGKDALDGCDDDALAPHVAFMHREPYLYRCVELGIAPGGTASLRLGEAGMDVIGMIARKGGGNARDVTWRVGEASERKLGERRHDFLAKADEAPAVLAIDNAGDDIESVCVAAAEMR